MQCITKISTIEWNYCESFRSFWTLLFSETLHILRMLVTFHYILPPLLTDIKTRTSFPCGKHPPHDCYYLDIKAPTSTANMNIPQIHARYVPRDPKEAQTLSSSIQVLRVSDNQPFLATKIPNLLCKDAVGEDDEGNPTITTNLAAAILPVAAKSISRILNHPNLISLIDIVHKSLEAGNTQHLGDFSDVTIWEDMDAGCLSYLLPPVSKYPAFADEKAWFALAAQNFQRSSLPESLCWHVLKSMSRALLWLHFGIKETVGIPGEYLPHDDDWQPILIMDVSPAQMWFKRAQHGETYGACKLGGFQWAKVTGMVGGRMALAQRKDDAHRRKQYYWSPVSLSIYFRWFPNANIIIGNLQKSSFLVSPCRDLVTRSNNLHDDDWHPSPKVLQL